MFPNAIGPPLDSTDVYHELKKLLQRAVLPTSYCVHDLRHTTATYLLTAGVPHRTVMEFVGHSQISVTVRYQHVLPAMLADAATKLEAILPGATRAV